WTTSMRSATASRQRGSPSTGRPGTARWPSYAPPTASPSSFCKMAIRCRPRRPGPEWPAPAHGECPMGRGGMTGIVSPPEIDRGLDGPGRDWVSEAMRKIAADFNRSSDTHLIKLDLPCLANIDFYLKDESTHPSGSLKHRLARSLILYGLCNGWI